MPSRVLCEGNVTVVTVGTKVTSIVSLGSVLIASIDVEGPAVVETNTITGSKVTEGVKSGDDSGPGEVTTAERMDPMHPPSTAPRTLSAGMMAIRMPRVTPAMIPATSREETPLVFKDLPSLSDVSTLRTAPVEIPEMSGVSAGEGTGVVAAGSDIGAVRGSVFVGMKTVLKVRVPFRGSNEELCRPTTTSNLWDPVG